MSYLGRADLISYCPKDKLYCESISFSVVVLKVLGFYFMITIIIAISLALDSVIVLFMPLQASSVRL